MSFCDALKLVAEGKKITKLEWNDESVYLILHKDKVHIHTPSDKMLHPLIVTTGDILGDDYIVI